MEQVAAASTGPKWFELYLMQNQDVSRSLIRRAKAAGYQAIVVVVDTTATGNRELLREGGRPLLRSRATMRANLEPVIVIGCEGVVAGHESLINKLSGEAWERWVELNYRLGRDPATHGASDHLLAVGRRAG